jgi:tetratricopeptide (TPR) repeat protein
MALLSPWSAYPQDLGQGGNGWSMAAQMLNMGNRQQAEGQLAEAVSSYTRALTLNSNFAEAYVGRAMAEQAEGKFEEASADYVQALRIRPKMAEAHNNYASLLYEKGDMDGALVEFDKAIKLNRRMPEPHAASGMIYYLKGEMKKSIECFTRAIDLFPSFLEGVTALSARNPRLAVAYDTRALARQSLGDLTGALGDFDKAISINARADYFNNRAQVRFKLDDNEGALSDYASALAINPNLVVVYFNRGRALLQRGRKDEAISDFTNALTMRDQLAKQAANLPQNVSPESVLFLTFLNRGLAWEGKGDLGKAAEDYENAIQVGPKEASGYASRGRIEMESGQLDSAVADLNKAISMDATQPMPFMDRGLAWLMNGDVGAAEADFQKCLSMAPDLQSLLERREQAVRQVSKRIARQPSGPNGEPDRRPYFKKCADEHDAASKASVAEEVQRPRGSLKVRPLTA